MHSAPEPGSDAGVASPGADSVISASCSANRPSATIARLFGRVVEHDIIGLRHLAAGRDQFPKRGAISILDRFRHRAEAARHMRREQAKRHLLRGIEFVRQHDLIDWNRKGLQQRHEGGFRIGGHLCPRRPANDAKSPWPMRRKRCRDVAGKHRANSARSSTERARRPTLASRGTRMFEPRMLVKPTSA